jgi:hypothetical protein
MARLCISYSPRLAVAFHVTKSGMVALHVLIRVRVVDEEKFERTTKNQGQTKFDEE